MQLATASPLDLHLFKAYCHALPITISYLGTPGGDARQVFGLFANYGHVSQAYRAQSLYRARLTAKTDNG